MNGGHVNGKVQISSPVVESNGNFQEFWFNSSDVLNGLDECLGKVQTTVGGAGSNDFSKRIMELEAEKIQVLQLKCRLWIEVVLSCGLCSVVAVTHDLTR
ncbi:hypothetical protein C5167_033235 [Papaver somniferum]|uniref:Uncharacterized protein n=1 Tax=Papaver somniferum TaxID=3469 RepID=A0A4Y7KCM0_PAPSO|nr:hypothetical protein C5167_033235 [Papaver somniferum]